MLARDEIRIGVGLLLVVQLATSFGAIGLLTRMGPAIGQIMQENVVSIQATEAMLAALASQEGDVTSRRITFQQALSQAEQNITIEAERPILKKIHDQSSAGFDGDAQARRDLIAQLRELSHVNQDSMQQADQRARNLGTAGAWAAMLLGLAGFVLSLIIFRRMQERLLKPVQDVQDVLSALQQGDMLRRTSIHRAPDELMSISRDLNALLDSQSEREVEPWSQLAGQDRALLLALLDARAQPALLFDVQGQLHATNKAAQELGDATYKRLAGALQAEAPQLDGWRFERLADAGWLVSKG